MMLPAYVVSGSSRTVTVRLKADTMYEGKVPAIKP